MKKFDKKRAMKMAGKMAKEFDERKVGKGLERFKGAGFFGDIKLLYRMITDSRYELSTSTKAVITGALVYVVSPVDAIPDVIPVVGWTDDAAVVSMVVASLGDEIDRYRVFLEEMAAAARRKAEAMRERMQATGKRWNLHHIVAASALFLAAGAILDRLIS